MASTPAPTPPPPRPVSQQQQIVYNINGAPPMANGGMMAAPNSFGGYPDPNMYTQTNFYTNGTKPQIYTVRSDSLCTVAKGVTDWC